MISIIISLVIGVLLGYIGAGEYRELVWVVFALITILIVSNVKGKLDISSFLAILFGGIGLILTQYFSPDAYSFIATYIQKYIDMLFTFIKNTTN